MTCNRLNDSLDAYLDGDVPAAEEQEIEAHVAGCSFCSTLLDRERAITRALQAQPVDEPRAGFFEDAIARAATNSAKSRRVVWTTGVAAALAASLAIWLAVPQLRPVQPDQAQPSPVATVSLSLHEARTINLVFSSATAIPRARLSIELPPGVQLAGYEGRQNVKWKTRLRPGKNVLPLELILQDGSGGDIVARLNDGREQKTFRVQVRVAHAPDVQSFNAIDDRSERS